jgi:hypothetical protein
VRAYVHSSMEDEGNGARMHAGGPRGFIMACMRGPPLRHIGGRGGCGGGEGDSEMPNVGQLSTHHHISCTAPISRPAPPRTILLRLQSSPEHWFPAATDTGKPSVVVLAQRGEKVADCQMWGTRQTRTPRTHFCAFQRTPHAHLRLTRVSVYSPCVSVRCAVCVRN